MSRNSAPGAGVDLRRGPGAGGYATLSESFGRRFTVSIDTEEEFDWGRPLTRAEHGVAHGRSLPAIQTLLADAGLKPLYLIDWPIAADAHCAALLRAWVAEGVADVGTQLHPWVNPPFDEELSPYNSFAGNLPRGLEQAKLLALTGAIEQAVGRRPDVYRAGRYGVGPNSAALLIEAGYRMDVSVRPHHDYSAEGGPDFRGIAPRPYWVADGALLEVPLSAAFIGGLRRFGAPLHDLAGRVPKGRGLLARAGLVSRVALSPEGVPLAEALEAVERMLDEGERLFSLSFHSPSIEAGHTPYVRDAADLKVFHGWWAGMFDRFAARGVLPCGIDEIWEAALPSRGAGAAACQPLGSGSGSGL